MNRFPQTALVVASALTLSGCHLFSKAGSEPKPNPAVATAVEVDFMTRWVDKRANDLYIQGTPKPAAREQALGEFRAKFHYAGVAVAPAAATP